MKTKYTMFRRGEMFYMQDSATGKQTSLRTKDETEAKSLLEARNAAQRQPVLNLHLARAYLTASDPAFVERTWSVVMEQMQSRGKESSRERYASVFKSPSFDSIRNKKLMETTADDFFAVFKQNQVSINEFLKRLHNFAVHLGWIAIPIVAPYLWPKYEPKDRRGITQAEHESVLAKEKNAEWKLYLELLWETGAAQSDAVNFKAEDIDWQSRTISYFRMKTGSLAQFTISKALEMVLSHLPTTGALFPKLSTFTANDRASRFRRRCHKAGVTGVTLHCYRYAWAERAKVVGMPERFAQAALGHNSKAIHRAYKFNEAVEDEVVLDLMYEARDISQQLGSPQKVDAWFDAKTKGLNDWQKAALREQWGTMQKVLSSRSRMERVVEDIVFDFSVKPRLSSERGNAILVASSIYEAAKYFELFQKTVFKGRCAVVTSYNPQAQDVTLEETGANTQTEKQFLYDTYMALLKDVEAKPGKTKTETYEDNIKELFIKQPANMRLLIVVDKLLTGFDAPSCTYLYIDKSMQDHGLFQAICRTNRLDGEDKTFGYIVDYKDLFKKLVNEKGTGALQVYTSELDHTVGGASPEVLMQDRLKKGKERLDGALETVELLCDPVLPPKGELEHIHYFCGNTEIADDLKVHEPQRAALYKSVAALVRAFANIADDLANAGYSNDDISKIKGDIDRALKLREIIRQASGETIDLKAYEADMRHLIDTYIEANEPKKISNFDDMGLLDVIANSGMADAIASLPEGIKGNKSAIAETIANNVRSKIIKEHLNDPVFYDRMSVLLKEILDDLRAKRIDYEEFLKRMAEVAKQVQAGKSNDTPARLDTPGKRALFNNLSQNEQLALDIDAKVKQVRPEGWRGHKARENIIKAAILPLLGNNKTEVERIFLIISAQREY